MISLLFRIPSQMEDLALFTRHISASMQARAPLPDILRAYQSDAESSPLRKAITPIVKQVESGVELSAAIEEHPKVFPGAYRRMVKIGEQGRTLGATMQQLAENLDENLKTYEYFRRAAIYPLLLLLLLFVDFTFIVVTITPKFAAIYEELGAELTLYRYVPIMFKVMLGLMIIPIGFTLATALGLRFRGFGYGRYALNLPLIGPVLRRAEIARFAHQMSLLLENRVPLAEALGLMSESTDNTYVRAAILDLQRRYEAGEKLSEIVSRQPLFPPGMAAIIASSEDQGNLAEALRSMGKYYSDRTAHGLTLLRETFEPVMLLLIGVMMALILLTLYQPLFNIPRVIGM